MSGGRLIVLDRAGRDAKQYALAEGLATLGSDLACDIRLMLPAVSPHHATVMVQANQTVIQSVSEGVTFLNDVPVSVAILRHGDIISMGGRALRWEYSHPQHRPLAKPQPALVAVNKTRRGKAHRSRSSDPIRKAHVHTAPRTSLHASSMKQVAIVQPQRRGVLQGEPSCIPVMTEEPAENSNTLETTRKSARPNQKNPQANTKASEWIESRKSNSQPLVKLLRARSLTPATLLLRSQFATRSKQTLRETLLRSRSLGNIPLEKKSARPLATKQTVRATSSAAPVETSEEINFESTTTLTPKQTRQSRSRSLLAPLEMEATTKSMRRTLTPKLKREEESTESATHKINTPKRTLQSRSKSSSTPFKTEVSNKSATQETIGLQQTRKSRSRTSLTPTETNAATKSTSKPIRRSSSATLELMDTKYDTSSIVTPKKPETRLSTSANLTFTQPSSCETTHSSSLFNKLTPNLTNSFCTVSLKRSLIQLKSRPSVTRILSDSIRPSHIPLIKKRVLPPRARTLTPRAQAFARSKLSVVPIPVRQTSLRSTILKKTHRPVKIQAPSSIDHTKQAAILLMTGHKKSRSPNSLSMIVKKSSPIRQSLLRSPQSRESSSAKRNNSVLNINDEISRSSSCSSARKSAMKTTLKGPKSARKAESIKFDLSNLENDKKSDRIRSSVATVDTTNQTFDSFSSVQHGTPSPRRPIHSRSSRIIEKTLGSPMTYIENTKTSIKTSARSKSSRGSLIVQKALGETLKSQSDMFRPTNLTKSLSPQVEMYSIVDLVSRDSNMTEYYTNNSTPFGTPRSHRETRYFDPALPSSTPYKLPRNQNMEDESAVPGESPEVITPENNENNKPVPSARISKRSRSKSRINDSDLVLLEDEDSPRTSKRADKSANISLDVSHVKRKLSQSLTESDEESEKSDVPNVKYTFTKAPKNSLSEDRENELFTKSPKNDLHNVSDAKAFSKSAKQQKTPKNTLEDVRGVRKLFRGKDKTPKNTLEDVRGIRDLFRRSPRNDLRVSGVKDALKIKSPKNDLTDVGVRSLFSLEKDRFSSSVSGVNEISKENSVSDTSFDLLMGKPSLRTYKAASAQKMKNTSNIRKVKSLFDSTTMRVEDWPKKPIQVYSEKSLPLKKRSLKAVKSTPMKHNVTLNSTELRQISPIAATLPVATPRVSQFRYRTNNDENNSSILHTRSIRSLRSTRSLQKNFSSLIRDTILEEPSTSRIQKKITGKNTNQQDKSTGKSETQNIPDVPAQKDKTKTTRRKMDKEIQTTPAETITRSKTKPPSKVVRRSIVVKTQIQPKLKVKIEKPKKNAKQKEEDSKGKNPLPTPTPRRTRSKRVSVAAPIQKKNVRKAKVTENSKENDSKDTKPKKPVVSVQTPRHTQTKRVSIAVPIQKKNVRKAKVTENSKENDSKDTKPKKPVVSVKTPRHTRTKRVSIAVPIQKKNVRKAKVTENSKEKDSKDTKPKKPVVSVKTPRHTRTKRVSIAVPIQKKNVRKAKVTENSKENDSKDTKPKKPVVSVKTPRHTRTKRVSIAVPIQKKNVRKAKVTENSKETPVASPKRTRNKKQAVKKSSTPKEDKVVQEQKSVAPKRGRKGTPTEENVVEVKDIEKPKRGRKGPIKKVQVIEVKNVKKEEKKGERANVQESTSKVKVEVATTKGQKIAQKETVAPDKPSRKRKSPDVVPLVNEDIERPKRGRKNLVEKKIAEAEVKNTQKEVKTRATANVQPSTSKVAAKVAPPKGKKAAQVPVTPAKTSRKRKSDQAIAPDEPNTTKMRKAAVIESTRTTRSKAVPETQPKTQGRKR